MIVAGCDVWKGQWVVVVLEDGKFSRGFIAPEFADALANLEDASVIGVDIPIGLPETGIRRECDVLAREFVGVRRNSVFFTPSAELLACESAAEANKLALRLGIKGVSAQTFALKKQIFAVQPFAESDERIFEVHPEVSFRAAYGEDLVWPKNSWNGQMLRQGILRGLGVKIPQIDSSFGNAEPADVLDAAIVAWSAERISVSAAKSLTSLKMRISSIRF